MTAVAFDTHAYVKQLEAVGFTEQQAEVLAATQSALLTEQIATKTDLEALRTATKADIADVRRDLKELD